MDDLRSEIRAAFQEEQEAHPPLAGLRFTLTSAAAAQPRPSRNLQWIAVAVAAILGILVVAGLVSTRLAPRANLPATNPGSLKDFGPPPSGVPLFYLIDPRNNTWLQAYDWEGKPRGTVKFGKPVNVGYTSIIAAPDGSGFRYLPESEQGGVEYLDRLGRPIAPGLLPPAPHDVAWAWADDSRHLCVVRFATPSGEWRLYTTLPGEADHLVGIIPLTSDIGDPAPLLGSCSVRNDRAIVLRSTGRTSPSPDRPPSELLVFRISDGKVLADYKYSDPGQFRFGNIPRGVGSVGASSDGLLIAEVSSRSTGQPGAGAPLTIIRRVSDGSVVATLDPSVKVLAFSGDDSRVFAAIDMGYTTAPGQPLSLSVIDLKSGQVIWHEQDILMTWNVQPDGPDFAISSVVSGPTGTTGPLGNFEIIHGDGSVTRIPGSYTPA
jgi:hypothetical protein